MLQNYEQILHKKKIQNYSFCTNDHLGKGYSSYVYKGRN
jgi:hypothetical protein